jgi:hypothetical protein
MSNTIYKMSNSILILEYFCSKCNKQCKDKRGLSIHENKCGIIKETKEFICEYCNVRFSTNQTLQHHTHICSSRIEKEKMKAYEEEKKRLQEIINKQNEMYNKKEEEFKREKIRMNQHSDMNLKEILAEQKELHNKCNELQRTNNLLVQKNQDLQTICNQLHTEESKTKNKLADLAMKLAEASSQSTTSYHQNIIQTNNVYIPPFDPSVIQGKINPPEIIVGSCGQLVTHLLRLGFGNFVRSSDRARKVLTWFDKDKKLIKDQNGTKLARQIIETLKDELEYQKIFFEEKGLDTEASFCRNLLNYDEQELKNLQRHILERAKDKTDTSIDSFRPITYVYFTQDLEELLFPNILNWIHLSMFDFGRFIYRGIRKSIIIEGASYNVKNKYIVLTDGQDQNHIIEADRLGEIIQDVILEVITKKTFSCLLPFLEKEISYNKEHIDQFQLFLTDIKEEQCIVIMNGILEEARRG